MLIALDQMTQPQLHPPSLATFLLLETEILDEWLVRQPDSPERAAIGDFVRKVDYATSLRWVWGDTEYDNHHADGPVLVQYQSDSRLSGFFIDPWASTGGAVFLASSRSIDEVIAQLRAVLFVLMPNGNKARFRIQETTALASVLRALAPFRAAALLGPIQELIWRESLGPAHQWWRYRQPDGPHPVQGGFQFNHAEMSAIDAGLTDQHLLKHIAITRQAPHSFRDDPRQQTRVWMEQLNSWGFKEFSHLDSALDAFRHPAYRRCAAKVIEFLEDPAMTPGARAARALNYLMTEGH
ncbi:DUF4123 domain-containing protein [Achromobacter mucicolens]|uniref:DUF4123 domain-containing protein n=1 Tax=Achromobacter mucicolens TaxID=1389922 RepID=UPI00245352E9|nr:DUF4123 domain-containing protein [Achromobacter mucicolens]WGJ89526.1 DUF4123 domain-containing protein [Achromobacter mucicolens]